MKARLEKGEPYIFISTRTLLPVFTHDCYFPSDNEKWTERNYFASSGKASAVSSECREKYSKRIQELEAARESNKNALIAQVTKLAKAGDKAANDNTRAKVVEALVKAYRKYYNTTQRLGKESSEITAGVRELIKELNP